MARKKIKSEGDSTYWTGYVDLMTNLFFIMLLLAVFAFWRYSNREDSLSTLEKENTELTQQLKASRDELEAIRKIEASTKDLEGEYFRYDEVNKKYILNLNISFPTGSDNLTRLNNQSSLRFLENAGSHIVKFLGENSGNQYLLILEGQASSDNYDENYELSYKRALRVVRYWTENCGLSFRSNCDILIAGSGDGDIPTNSVRDTVSNEANQRIVIHLIPKNIFRGEQQTP